MAVTDTGATERVEPEPAATLDPSISPVHHQTMHSLVPAIGHHQHAPARRFLF
jgi:hypothetical protein